MEISEVHRKVHLELEENVSTVSVYVSVRLRACVLQGVRVGSARCVCVYSARCVCVYMSVCVIYCLIPCMNCLAQCALSLSLSIFLSLLLNTMYRF